MDLGGAQQAVLYLANHLSRDLFEQVFIAGEGGLLSPDLLSVPSTRHHTVSELNRHVGARGLTTDLRAIAKIRNILQRERPDIVHTHTPKAGILGRWASWLAGIPRIAHTFHGFGFSESHPTVEKRLYVWAERITGMITTQFVVVSEKNRLKGQNYGFFRQHSCELIRSGIDLSTFTTGSLDKPQKKIELGLCPSDKIVGIVAGFKPPKGLNHFLEVARRVVNRRPEIKFLMIGDGELRPQLEAEVNRLQLDSAVRMLGWRRDIPDLLQLLDVFVLTSHWEGLPRVLLEAMAAGVPIVATDVDGIGEVVQTEENGYLVGPGDTTKMAERVLELLGNEELCFRMGQKSQSMVKPFSAQKMVEDYTHLYFGMMGWSSRCHSELETVP
jgi:glycosyltransferase involved in cell wall biosynthesis